MRTYDEIKQATPPVRPETDYTTCDLCHEVTLKEDCEFIDFTDSKRTITRRVCTHCIKELDL